MPAKKTPGAETTPRHNISFNLTSLEEKQRVKKLAKASKLSISAYMRELARYAVDEEIQFETKCVRKPK